MGDEHQMLIKDTGVVLTGAASWIPKGGIVAS